MMVDILNSEIVHAVNIFVAVCVDSLAIELWMRKREELSKYLKFCTAI